MEELTIGELARRTCLAVSAIRYYESVGLLEPLRRVNRRRYYGPNAERELSMLHASQEAGFTIAEIRVLFTDVESGSTLSDRWKQLAMSKLQDVDRLIERAIQMRTVLEAGLECGCLTANDCVLVSGPKLSANT